MALDPTSIVPSVSYLGGVDNVGTYKLVDQPARKSLLLWDGTTFHPADGTNAHQIVLDYLAKSGAGMGHIAAFDASGRMFRWSPLTVDGDPVEDSVRRYPSIINGNLTWAALAIKGVPAAGTGLVTREYYDPTDLTTPVPESTILNTPGTVYIPDRGAGVAGTPTTITNGSEGQQYRIVNGVPTWTEPPAGSVSSGVSSAGLFGVAIDASGTHAVNVQVPSITVAKTDGTSVKLTAVNVSANLTASVGVGGLDAGSGTSNQWYYVYLVSDGIGGVGAVISTNGSSPSFTALAAYLYYASVGVFRTDGSGNIIAFIQRGREVYITPKVWGDNISVNAAFNAIAGGVALSTLIPPNAKSVQGMLGGSTTETSRRLTMIAADSSGIGQQAISSDDFSTAVDGFFHDCGNFRMPVINPSAPSLYWKLHAGSSSHRRIVITGYSI